MVDDGGDKPASGSDAGKVTVLLTLAALRQRLKPFLDAHPYSAVEEVDSNQGKRFAVVKPWGDESLLFYVPDDPEAFVNAINNVLMPERFTAVWHRDSKDFEIIFTAHRLPDEYVEMAKNRKFTFRHKGHDFECEFGRSSERLLTLARSVQPISISTTQYRNMYSFNAYVLATAGKSSGDAIPKSLIGEPVSFWVRSVEWSEEEILSLVRSLNFYASYFDRRSPIIMTWPAKTESIKTEPQIRYIAGSFPAHIIARPIDEILLHFWEFARTGDSASRFLHCYRIIEYLSLSYLEKEITHRVRRLLQSPNVSDPNSDIAIDLVAAIQESNLTDAQRFDRIVRTAIDPDTIWREMETSLTAFTADTSFHGGLTVKAIARVGWRAEDFDTTGVPALSMALRSIRNCLAHGREPKTNSVITPTPDNFAKLQPWASIISVVASQVMLYKNVE